jgi:hypothetical protein
MNKGLIIIARDLWASENARDQIKRWSPDMEVEMKEWFKFDYDSLRTIPDEGYRFVILPLSLRDYGSLYLAEATHRAESPTRVMLVSGTNGPEHLFNPLFDVFVPFFRINALREAFMVPLTRIRDEKRLHGMMEGILQTANCFRVRQRDRQIEYGAESSVPGELDDYIRMVKEKGGQLPCASPSLGKHDICQLDSSTAMVTPQG